MKRDKINKITMKKKSDIIDKELRELLTDFIYLVVAVIGFVATMIVFIFAVCEVEKLL